MGFEKKEWKDRVTEYPTRRNLVKDNGSTEIVTVERNEGNVSQEGDAFSAENMNGLEERIQNAIGTGDIPEELGTDIISAINSLNTLLKALPPHVICTRAQYDAMPEKEQKLYVIVG